MSLIKDFKAVKVLLEEGEIDGEKVVRVRKFSENPVADDNTFAKFLPVDGFHNGTIKMKVYSKFKEDAPEFARGFIGLVFRSSDDDTAFESFYVRPTNGRNCNDSVRYAHTVQYFSCPKYTFSYFRENNILGYEAHADIDMEEWIDLKVVVSGNKADFYVNDQMVLSVRDLKMGKDARGSIGLYVDHGTDGYFKEIEVECVD